MAQEDTELIEKGSRLGAKTILGGLFLVMFAPSYFYIFISVAELQKSTTILATELPALNKSVLRLQQDFTKIADHMVMHEKEIPKYQVWKAGVEFSLQDLYDRCQDAEEDIEKCEDRFGKGF